MPIATCPPSCPIRVWDAPKNRRQRPARGRALGQVLDKFRSNFTAGFTTGNIDYYLANETELGPFVSYDSRSVIYSFYNKYTLEYNPSSRLSVKAMINGNYHAVNIFDRITEEGYSAERTSSVPVSRRITVLRTGFRDMPCCVRT